MRAILVLLPLTLTSCAGFMDFSAQATADKKLYNNTQANFYKQVPCDMTIGAYYRTLNDVEQQAISSLCGGDFKSHVTAEDVQAIQDFMELRERSRDALD